MSQGSAACPIDVFSREHDTVRAEAAARTLALAMSRDPQTPLWCKDPRHYLDDWWATIYNYQLKMPQQPFLHANPDNSCVAYAYWYPEQKPEYGEGEGPTPEGGVDTSSWERTEAQPLLADCLAYLKQGKEQFQAERGSFLYVAYMGVHPDRQRQGLGSAMLQHLCDQCDQAGKWAYLEASNTDNARLYKRFGFEPLGKEFVCCLPEEVPGLRVTFVILARPPQTPAAHDT